MSHNIEIGHFMRWAEHHGWKRCYDYQSSMVYVTPAGNIVVVGTDVDNAPGQVVSISHIVNQVGE